MTVHREPIHLALESAPSDRFDDDAARVYRVVAFVGTGATRRHKVALTRDHDSEQDAMSVFADKVLHATGPDNLTGQVIAGHVDRLTVRLDDHRARIAELETRKGRR